MNNIIPKFEQQFQCTEIIHTSSLTSSQQICFMCIQWFRCMSFGSESVDSNSNFTTFLVCDFDDSLSVCATLFLFGKQEWRLYWLSVKTKYCNNCKALNIRQWLVHTKNAISGSWCYCCNPTVLIKRLWKI